MSNSDRPILIKKVKKIAGHGHHGGAWKVAYADFVTAMMAFFLLMWLINTTDPEQKRGIAEYFAPASVSQTTSGSGGLLGGTALGDDGVKSDGSTAIVNQLAPEAPDQSVDQPGRSSDLSAASEAELREEIARREAADFASAAASLRQAMQLACTHFRLTPEEALRGATVNGARALGLHDRGRLRVGQRADFVAWNVGHPSELCYWLGGDLVHRAHAGGARLG